VPAHTIAWLYDSRANETTVYVNPTDQTLSIGDTGLVEIHLEGIATIQPSDFALASATVAAAPEPELINLVSISDNDAVTATTSTAVASSDQAVSDDTFLINWNKTAHTTKVDCFRFDAGLDHPEVMAGKSELQSVHHDQASDDGNGTASPYGGWTTHSAMSPSTTSHDVDHTALPQTQTDPSAGAIHADNAGGTHADNVGSNVAPNPAPPTGSKSSGNSQPTSNDASEHGVASTQAADAHDLGSSAPTHPLVGSHPAAALFHEEFFHFKPDTPSSKGLDVTELKGFDVTELTVPAADPSSILQGTNVETHHGPHAAQSADLLASGHFSEDVFHAVAGHAANALAAHLHELMV